MRHGSESVSGPVTAVSSGSRLQKVLAVGHLSAKLQTLTLPSDPKESETGPKVKQKEHLPDRLQDMGVNLANDVYPTAMDNNFKSKQLFAMATYYLHRSNYGSDGVVWSGKDFGGAYDATALFISETGGYDDKYLNYVQAQNRRVNDSMVLQDELPEIMYDYPPNTEDTSHLKYLEKEDLKDKSRYTNFHESPASKVYVFFKMKTSDQRPKYGPYLFLGRFMVMPRLETQNAKQIRLKYYEPPLSAKLQYRRMNPFVNPAPKAAISQSDVDSVITTLSKLSSRQSNRGRRAAAAAAAASRDVEEPPEERPDRAVPAPATPGLPPPQQKPFRIKRKPPAKAPSVPIAADDGLEDGEILENEDELEDGEIVQ